ncbi:MAG: helix-turn-helix domain-containing protein [Candidatus Aminicenantes bacterium]|nr:helix-turn-helix domain-containing protein [Candidatus Aminicenantes bacterium]NIM78815.1 helix-turn-helix domain-containing protein [Candidatus Aminicenantes bacterium]NIN18070.1 helix-turn-helix domain-containing protein [Candidatus Aminicenantes bacterium]NIN41969.1 helix-turn-helix domain-containing protein [Candidatus Aminicenantes bacterium]NIN84725.1 helix-turn-helix domain-containing protein [Candidatus Aminicenantes bacterium]
MKKKLVRVFGQRLREIREGLRMTQTAFAGKMGMSNSYLCDMESGHVGPGLYTLYRITKFYNISPLYLVHGIEPVFLDQEKEEEKKKEVEHPLQQAPEPEPLDFGEDTTRIREMLSYFKRSPVVKYALLGFFSKFVIENKAIIEEDIKKNEEKTNPGPNV